MHFLRSQQSLIQFRALIHSKLNQQLRPQTSYLHTDDRYRLSNFWTPTRGLTPTESEQNDSNSLLVQAGFIRPTHAGIFQMLPLGLRVQEKIEMLLDKHMRSLGASKVSLSSFSSEKLWRKSGRLEADQSELFQISDRKGTKFLLAPTHEEEITSLVANSVQSYKDLPLRLYQVTRKYRDERRPRQGLLRAREFLMKDLYTFDSTKDDALKTYDSARSAYAAFFEEIGIPYLTAEATSGNIGGDLSHEYHIPSPKGEDHIYTCETCKTSINEEMLERNKSLKSLLNKETHTCPCPKCKTTMQAVTSIELGHTFYLGTKYSEPLGAYIDTPKPESAKQSPGAAETPSTVPIEMGCHGIGVSRLIAGVADALSDTRGLNWPPVIAPFQVAVLHGPGKLDPAQAVWDSLHTHGLTDVVLDDREKDLVWMMKDADLIGYPVLVVIGKAWAAGKCEVQCRRLGIRENVALKELVPAVRRLLEQL